MNQDFLDNEMMLTFIQCHKDENEVLWDTECSMTKNEARWFNNKLREEGSEYRWFDARLVDYENAE